MTGQAKPQKTKTVAKPDVALADYLDTLLAEIDAETARVTTTEPAKADTVQADILHKGVAESTLSQDTASLETVDEVLRPAEVPDWAELPFQVLMFSVNKINLAVPLSRLSGILTLEDRISQLPGQPAWSLGVAVNHDTKVVVADTRRLLMPEVVSDEQDTSSLKHVLLIGEGERGLAVDALKGTIMLDKEAIRWRGAKGRHPWYAGIIIEELTALLDVDGVMEMLVA